MPDFRLLILGAAAALTLASLGASGAAVGAQYSATCSSSGQLCNKSVRVEIGYYNTLRVGAPPEHCSQIRYLLRDRPDFPPFRVTAWLAPGAWDSVYLDGEEHDQIWVGAEGRAGGCNGGQLKGWGLSTDVISKIH